MIIADNQKKEEDKCPFYNLVLFPDSNKFFKLDEDLCSLLFPNAESASEIKKGLCGMFLFPFSCTMKLGNSNPDWMTCLNHWGEREGLRNIADNYYVFLEEEGKFAHFDLWF